ncbi:MAG TPA: ABC transporter substrate-binding protein [Alphaproteobacteria bacterium]
MTRLCVARLASAAIALGLAAGSVAAEPKYGPGASDTEIKVGNTNPYSGPASAYGAIGKAIGGYFDMVNANGGINGRKVNFISYDDGYSPPKTVEQIRRLVEQDEVLLLFQTLGTPTNSAIHKYVNSRKVPHIFIATGATKWGNPKEYPWTMGWQPPYSDESKIYAKYVLDNVDDPKIAVLYQNDDYGKDYVDGFRAGLGELADKLIVAEAPYEVTDPTIDSQIVEMQASGANVFFNVTTPKFAAQAIRKVYDIGWRPLHLLNNVSNSVEAVLKPAGLDKSVGLISSFYLKDPSDPKWGNDADVKTWDAWMDKYNSGANKAEVFNAYGYAVAATLEATLRQCGDDLTRENVMRQAASLDHLEVPMLLPGITVTTGTDDFYPLQQLQLSRFDGTSWQPIGEVMNAF